MRDFSDGFNQQFGNFTGPYSPYLWAYPFIGDNVFDCYLPPPGDRGINHTIIVEPTPPLMSSVPLSKPAHAVINEYQWNEGEQ